MTEGQSRLKSQAEAFKGTMLWSKIKSESIEENGLYIDLLGNANSWICKGEKKRSTLSRKFISDGNAKLIENDLNGALKLFNRGMRFAEDNEHVCLANFWRSSCYRRLNLFERSLEDIKRAKQIDWKKKLERRLERRRKFCNKKLNLKATSRKGIITVNGKTYKKLPFVSSAIKIEKNDEFGRFVTATNDIHIGDTLLIEKSYVRVSTADECSKCAKTKMNFIPCDNCVDAMFCDKDCVDNDFHSFECGKIFYKPNIDDSKVTSCILRSIVVAINTFTTVDDLIAFVEHIRLTDPNEIIVFAESPIDKYKAFFKLSTYITDKCIWDFRNQAKDIYDSIMSSTDYAAKFDTLAKQRFLVHLICHHAAIVRSNGFPTNSGIPGVNDDDFDCTIALESSYFNHSCLPNAVKLYKDDITVIRAIQPIKAGQQIFVDYLQGDLTKETSRERNEQLEFAYKFTCQCELCVNGIQKAPTLRYHLDYVFVKSKMDRCDDYIIPIRKNCVTFLQNHPKNVSSQVGYYMLSTLAFIYQKELSKQ
ncbi:N-lysine methyltransferase SMYD2 [Pseudolycoriella hygida]|uniref:N-lysine methyltransferase SMYD2 n=1 Tax=Pseudolycoriella hygida TaxID=35572 RepID=A0A9Q0NHR5_9DIPT|nr:N-lysine methyltransferase SMYD2 [Pseudolycoriella hygida]